MTKVAKASKNIHYKTNKEKRAEEQPINIIDGVFAAFKRSAPDKIKELEEPAKQAFNAYMSQGNFALDKSMIQWHDDTATKQIIDDLNLDGKLGEVKAVTITIPNSQRIGQMVGEKMKIDGELMMKLTISENEKTLKQSLNKRNLRSRDLELDKANLIIVNDEEDNPMVIILRNVIPLKLSEAFNSFRVFYDGNNTLYTRGCRAAGFPSVDEIIRAIQDPEACKAAGFTESNVKCVIGLRTTGKNVYVQYINKKNEEKKWTFTTNLDRKAFDRDKFKGDDEINDLLKFVEGFYCCISKYWVRKFGCSDDRVETEVENAMQQLQLSGGLVKQYRHRMGIHSDPSSPFPNCIFGNTTHQWNNDTNDWGDRICDGGRLVLVDGCLYIDYNPLDLTFINGNLLHSVTNLRQLKNKKKRKRNGGGEKGKCDGHDRRDGHHRFSMQLFSNFRRNEYRHSKYGVFTSKW